MQVAAAQDSRLTADPAFAAVLYVLDTQESVPDLPEGGGLVIDVVKGPGGEALGLDAAASATRLAARLNARPGRLAEVMSCPDRAPTPEEYASGYWGCRFTENTEMVLTAGDPFIENDGLFVWVGVYVESKDRAGKVRRVDWEGYEVAFTRQEGEDWTPVGIRLRSASEE